MMHPIYRYLPLAIVQWIAVQKCERIRIAEELYVNPLPGVLLKLPYQPVDNSDLNDLLRAATKAAIE